MAKNDDTEEKSLPPSQVKLNRLRREGQVPRSKDLPLALSLLVVTGYIFWTFPTFLRQMSESFDFMLMAARQTDPSEAVMMALPQAGAAAFQMIWPCLLLAWGMVLLISIADAQGFPVAMKNMAPDFNRLNPTEGLKKIFSLSSLSEFVKGFLKLVLLAIGGGGATLYFMNAVFWSPICGESCALTSGIRFIGTLLVIGALILLLFAFADIRLSRALFRWEHRMTKTEARREQKDTQGDPKIKSARRQIGAEMRNAPPRKERPSSE
ncbi:EscU/YscU/HrcU family type III secretion system export apparatus switch protein [Rhizobium paknamense]|uniref:Type III secretion protein U n=1 Tax=Rhizobium paknamense TaxID=1206817 RepID=A0ABU0IDS2_9HYPH|nr:EscU/YscU/HrcU family type III secretion system export apparatus switch protein [Rhizobium paknamense]MDQ0456391.1 type III secretion protein U [Rhizobium paknamense]